MFVDILSHTLMISAFVFLMMLIIEYVNVVSRGAWQKGLGDQLWVQYLVAVLLGATPGCLGAFAVVAMYSHGVVSFGALVAAMITTCGDEAYVMLALIPEKALFLIGILAVTGLAAGWLTDVAIKGTKLAGVVQCECLEIHEEEPCDCFSAFGIVRQWRELSLARAALMSLLILFAVGVLTGSLGTQTWDWKRITIAFSVAVGVFVVATVPEHFLQEHLWRHIARQHLLRIFLWTFGALIVTHLLIENLHFESLIKDNVLIILLVACVVGIIPESGPHLIFVTLFDRGTVPFSTLFASSVVQDGHGMLPLLAQSGRVFLLVKAINLVVGLILGFIGYLVGW